MSAEKDYSNAEDITDVGEADIDEDDFDENDIDEDDFDENDIDEDEKEAEVDVVQETCYEYKQRRYEERLAEKKE